MSAFQCCLDYLFSIIGFRFDIWLMDVSYSGGQFFLRRIKEEPEKNAHPLQVTDELYQIILCRVHLDMDGIQTHNLNGDIH